MDKLIVIDASAVLSLLLNEPMAAKVLNVTIEARLISPASLPYEIANALSARVKANNQTMLSKEYAMKAYALYQAMPIELVAIDKLFHSQVFDMATTQRMYSYDAYLLLLAKIYQAPLLTLDGTGKKQGLIQYAATLGIPFIQL
jgi:predicted nucleic acid-binding protein